MDFKKIYVEALNERFKADAIIDKLSNRLCEQVEIDIFKKYDDIKHKSNGLEYKLIGVKTMYKSFSSPTIPNEINIKLYYVACFKLSKQKKLQAEKAIECFEKNGWFQYNTYKIPLWITNHYTALLDDGLNNKISLAIN